MSTIPISLLPAVTLNQGTASASSALPINFGSLLGQAVSSLQQGQSSANQTIQQAMAGNVSVTQAMVAMTQAQTQLDVATAVQNQALSAYQTIMNMPIG